MDWKLTYAAHAQCPRCEFHTVSELDAAGFTQLSASVPGNFELELVKAGIEPDFYDSTNVWNAQKYEATHVWYSTRVEIQNESQYLLFEGIDTFAEIYVNGGLSATSDNMFLPCEDRKSVV